MKQNQNDRFILIDPAMAATMLEQQSKNRHVNFRTVKRYARKMDLNGWISNFQTSISFNSLDKLIDGQHRLHAVILHNKPVVFFCRFNVSIEESIAESTSLNRSVSDRLVMFSNFDCNIAKNVVAIGRLIFTRLKTGKLYTAGSNGNHPFEMEEALNCFKLVECDPTEIAKESYELYLMQPRRLKIMMQSEIGYFLSQKSIGAKEILYEVCSANTSNLLACCIKKNVLNRTTKTVVTRRFSSLAFAKVWNNQKPLLKIPNLQGTPIPDLFDGNFAKIEGAA